MQDTIRPAARLWYLVQQEKSDITAIYFFAVLGGLIQLSVPVGIQAIIGFVLGGTLSASLVLLISIIVTAVLFTGMVQMSQMRVIERIQQRIFTRYAFAFADRIPKLDLKKGRFHLPAGTGEPVFRYGIPAEKSVEDPAGDPGRHDTYPFRFAAAFLLPSILYSVRHPAAAAALADPLFHGQQRPSQLPCRKQL